ncbi:MAG: GNAT family protein [Patescibacteria group bacterium]
MDRIIFRTGKKSALFTLEDKEEDIRKAAKWLNDYEGVSRFIGLVGPQSIIAEREWFARVHKDKENQVFGIATLEGKFIGMMGLHQINLHHRTAVTGAFIGEKEYRSGGYGTDAKMQLLHYAFTELNLFKVCSSVLSGNGRSLAYLKKTGYVVEGVKKGQVFRSNKRMDQVMLAVFKPEFMKLWRRYRNS